MLGLRVQTVREQSEADVTSGAGQMMDLEPFDLFQKIVHAGQQGGQDHECAQPLRNARGKFQTG